MGCICSKGIPANDYFTENHSKERHLKSNRSSRLLGASLRKEEPALHVDGGRSDAMALLISNQPGEVNAGSTPELDDAEKAAASAEPLRQEQPTMEDGAKRVGVHNDNATPRIVNVVNVEEGALVIAGWPSWLISVAGEAINGLIPRKAESFQKLDKITRSYGNTHKASKIFTYNFKRTKLSISQRLDKERTAVCTGPAILKQTRLLH